MTQVFVPHTHVREGTYLYLLQQTEKDDVVWVDVSEDRWAYTDHLQARWDEGKTFLNLEHDIVPWPGALEQLLLCESPWCFFGYRQNLDYTINGSAPFGLVKLEDRIIAGLPEVWRQMRIDQVDNPDAWKYNDIHFFSYAQAHGWHPHQHVPSVLNASPPKPNHVNMEAILQCPSPARSTSI